jgi:hypothetical protein
VAVPAKNVPDPYFELFAEPESLEMVKILPLFDEYDRVVCVLCHCGWVWLGGTAHYHAVLLEERRAWPNSL